MVLICQGVNWWIESFHVARASIADQAERSTTHTLERAGIFLGGSATLDHDITPASVTGLSMVLRASDNSELVIGESVISVESVVMNDSGSALVVGENVLVFMRGRGG